MIHCEVGFVYLFPFILREGYRRQVCLAMQNLRSDSLQYLRESTVERSTLVNGGVVTFTGGEGSEKIVGEMLFFCLIVGGSLEL